jgi:hypothetical protein
VSNADGAAGQGDPGRGLPELDLSRPVSARIWNYWLGGKDYYAIDKAVGDETAKVYPAIFEAARSSRLLIGRVVRYLAGEAGVRQFLDIGTGLPSHDNTHEIAQRVAPDARVVYVDNDPFVLAHARALLTSSPPGSTDYIDADLNDPASLLAMARDKLDFGRPIAIMLMGILGHIGDPRRDDDAYARAVVDVLKAGLPSGGYLAISEGIEGDPEQDAALDYYEKTGAVPFRVRSLDQMTRLFAGLDLVEPGVVARQDWRPDPGKPRPGAVYAAAGVARKP